MSITKLQFGGWEFFIDLERTASYGAAEVEEHCICDDCLNFYRAIDRYYPKLRPFLAQFGVNVEAPEQMSPIAMDDSRIDYDPSYIVYGRIEKADSLEMVVENANVLAQWDGESDYFWLHTYGVSLPWTLDKPFDGAQTPFRKRIANLWGKLRNT